MEDVPREIAKNQINTKKKDKSRRAEEAIFGGPLTRNRHPRGTTTKKRIWTPSRRRDETFIFEKKKNDVYIDPGGPGSHPGGPRTDPGA